MGHTIQNDFLSVTVAEQGAECMSIRSADGTEYLWQGDSAYWKDRAPTLFPFIGRLTKNRCRCYGEEYPMGIHGFAAHQRFSVAEKSGSRLVLELGSNEETRTQYPFDFLLQIAFELEKNRLHISYRVENHRERTMPFAIGGHPGFRVPLKEGEAFTDYVLEFSRCCQPDRVGFTPAAYLSGRDEAYPLEEGRRMHLSHDMFNEDAVILKNMDRSITLRSQKSGRGVTVSYPQMAYLGIWHMPNTHAPYVCIEPWTSLPSRQDVIEELTCKSDMIQLEPKGIYRNTWTISLF